MTSLLELSIDSNWVNLNYRYNNNTESVQQLASIQPPQKLKTLLREHIKMFEKV